MTNYSNASLFLSLLLITILTTSLQSNAISSCNGPCRTLNDCSGQLICINRKCNDDPDVGTRICSPGTTPSPPSPSGNAISSCNGPCQTLNDCSGQLICINRKCNDDPDVGTRICSPGTTPSPPSPSGTTCNPTGFSSCGNKNTYQCSPPVTSATPAKLTLNDFSEGGDGGDPSSCDGQWHAKTERVVALSTGWFNGSSRCLQMIRITANGRSVTAKVVDECDSMNGCDQEHAFQPPCDNNVVDGSDAVWEALSLNKDLGIVPVTWSMA